VAAKLDIWERIALAHSRHSALVPRVQVSAIVGGVAVLSDVRPVAENAKADVGKAILAAALAASFAPTVVATEPKKKSSAQAKADELAAVAKVKTEPAPVIESAETPGSGRYGGAEEPAAIVEVTAADDDTIYDNGDDRDMIDDSPPEPEEPSDEPPEPDFD
jgi:hypothetical protein